MNESFFTNTFLGCSDHGLLYFLTVADTTLQENKTCKKKILWSMKTPKRVCQPVIIKLQC